jgi:hypothetical protein
MEKEKILMTSFLASNFADIASTAYALNLGFTEKGILGSGFVESGNFHEAAIIRTAVTAVMIGLYALTEENQDHLHYKWPYVFEKSMRAGNFISWGVFVLNTAQIAIQLLSH